MVLPLFFELFAPSNLLHGSPIVFRSTRTKHAVLFTFYHYKTLSQFFLFYSKTFISFSPLVAYISIYLERCAEFSGCVSFRNNTSVSLSVLEVGVVTILILIYLLDSDMR